MMKDSNKELFNSALVNYLSKSGAQVEIFLESGNCPVSNFKFENGKNNNLEDNFKSFIKWLGDKNLKPEIIISSKRAELRSEIKDKLTDYKGKKKLLIIKSIKDNLDCKDRQFKGDDFTVKHLFKFNLSISVSTFKKQFKKIYKKRKGSFSLKQVRKDQYKNKDFQKLDDIINFLVRFVYEEAKKDKDNYYKILKRNNNFGILPGVIKGCRANRRLNINLSNLNIAFCPNSVKEFNYGNILDDKSDVNPELMITTLNLDLKNLPLCETCLINKICLNDCFLTQYRHSGDLFIPHPEFCRFSHKKILFFLKAQNQLNLNNDQEKKLFNQIKELN